MCTQIRACVPASLVLCVFSCTVIPPDFPQRKILPLRISTFRVLIYSSSSCAPGKSNSHLFFANAGRCTHTLLPCFPSPVDDDHYTSKYACTIMQERDEQSRSVSVEVRQSPDRSMDIGMSGALTFAAGTWRTLRSPLRPRVAFVHTPPPTYLPPVSHFFPSPLVAHEQHRFLKK